MWIGAVALVAGGGGAPLLKAPAFRRFNEIDPAAMGGEGGAAEAVDATAN
jgi:hypothetical protein